MTIYSATSARIQVFHIVTFKLVHVSLVKLGLLYLHCGNCLSSCKPQIIYFSWLFEAISVMDVGDEDFSDLAPCLFRCVALKAIFF